MFNNSLLKQSIKSVKCKISIIIPNYNYAHHIIHALDSIFVQQDSILKTFNLNDRSRLSSLLEVIYIDDCSTDNSIELINEYKARNQHENLFIIKNSHNQGPAFSRNLGIQQADGNYLIFLDADDNLTTGSLIAIYDFIVNNNFPKVMISDHNNIFINSNKNKLISNKKVFDKYNTDNKKLLNAYLFSKNLSITAGSIIFHKDIFNHIKFCEHLKQNEDLPVFIYALANYPCFYLNFSTVNILKHQGSLRNQFSTLSEQENVFYLADIIFTEHNLKIYTSKKLTTLKNQYISQRYLSLFRSLYLAHRYNQAKLFYHKAIKYNFNNLFKLNYLRKYIKIYRYKQRNL